MEETPDELDEPQHNTRHIVLHGIIQHDIYYARQTTILKE